jgi:hypothetical protein
MHRVTAQQGLNWASTPPSQGEGRVTRSREPIRPVCESVIGGCRQQVIPLAGTAQFTININKAPTASTTVKVAYLVISASQHFSQCPAHRLRPDYPKGR